MSFDLNTASFTGHLGRDAETRYTNDGTAVTSFSLAVSGYKDKTTWLKVSVWGKAAEVCSTLTKGERVAVTGEVTLDEWKKQDGSTSSQIALRAMSVVFLTPKGEKKELAAPQSQPAQRPAQSSAPPLDDDIPFARERSWP